MSKHIHADLMLQYTKDWMDTMQPWKLWEIMLWCEETEKDKWFPLEQHPHWHPEDQYRRKPRTININGFDVPEPVREPLKKGQTMFIPNIGNGLSHNYYWNGSEAEKSWLKNGLVHSTREAAELHAKALLSFTEVQP